MKSFTFYFLLCFKLQIIYSNHRKGHCFCYKIENNKKYSNESSLYLMRLLVFLWWCLFKCAQIAYYAHLNVIPLLNCPFVNSSQIKKYIFNIRIQSKFEFRSTKKKTQFSYNKCWHFFFFFVHLYMRLSDQKLANWTSYFLYRYNNICPPIIALFIVNAIWSWNIHCRFCESSGQKHLQRTSNSTWPNNFWNVYCTIKYFVRAAEK